MQGVSGWFHGKNCLDMFSINFYGKEMVSMKQQQICLVSEWFHGKDRFRYVQYLTYYCEYLNLDGKEWKRNVQYMNDYGEYMNDYGLVHES